MSSFGKYVSNVVKTAISSFLPNKVVAYTRRQYDSEYMCYDVVCKQEPLFYFLKVANHFEMTYIPGAAEDQTGEEAHYAFSLFRFQGDEDSGIAAFTRHVEVLQPLHTARTTLDLSWDKTFIERITALCREQCGWTAAHVAAALPWPEVFHSPAVGNLLNHYDPLSGMTPLRIAITANDIKLVECLLALPNISLAGTDRHGDTVLHAAAKQCSLQILSLLLEFEGSQLDINALNDAGNTALHTACVKPSVACVSRLLDAGADPLIGLTELPLHLAVVADSLECVELIYRNCPEALNFPQPSDLSYPIHLATSSKLFCRLCELGANVDAQSASGLTVLHNKVLQDDLEAVLYLLVHGADPNLRDFKGATPLHYAVQPNPSVHIMRALIVFEADPCALDNSNQSPRHLLCGVPSTYSHSKERDLALYTLHAVGAKRCVPSTDGCNIGCMDPELARRENLTVFDGTAPEVTHNLGEDPANLFDGLFFTANQPQPSIYESTQHRRASRHTSVVRRQGSVVRIDNESLSFRHFSPTTSTSLDTLSSITVSDDPQTNGHQLSYQDSSLSLSPRHSTAQPCHFTLDSDLEDGLPQVARNAVSVNKSSHNTSQGTTDRVKLHFFPRDCACEEAFLNEMLEHYRNSDQSQLPTHDSVTLVLSGPKSSSSSVSECSDVDSVDSEFETTSPLCSPESENYATNCVNHRSALKQTVPKSRIRSRWNCGPHGYRALSMDGGGVRGLILVQTLRTLERATGKRIVELFDWIVGTSTGGILSLLLLRGKCLRCCRRMLFGFKDSVFCGKRPYPAEGLEKVIRRELGEHTKMTDLKRIRVAITTLVSDRCPPLFHMFRNYQSPRVRLKRLLQQKQRASATAVPSKKKRPTNNSTSNAKCAGSESKSVAGSSSVLNALMSASGFLIGGDSSNPVAPVENEGGYKFDPLIPDSQQLVWMAARATGAAPTYFRPCGRFLDGGLISNNPTLDLLTELQEMHMAQQLQNKPVTPLAVVVSLGTGRMPVEPIETVDVFRPQSLMDTFRSAMGFSSLGRIIVEVATMSEGPVVDRASAWCSSLGVPFFRFSPRLSLHVTLDTIDTKMLLQMVWETEAYLYKTRERIKELASIL